MTTAGGTGTTVDAYFYLDSTSLMGWWKADLGVTVDGSNGVSQLDDQSGNADANRNLAAATNRPTYFTIGANFINTSVAVSTPYVLCSVYNGAASAATYLSRWNTPAVTGNAGATGSDYLRTGTIVGGFPTQYRESEIIVFSGAHNSAKRQEIMEYLGAKYNIAVAA